MLSGIVFGNVKPRVEENEIQDRTRRDSGDTEEKKQNGPRERD